MCASSFKIQCEEKHSFESLLAEGTIRKNVWFSSARLVPVEVKCGLHLLREIVMRLAHVEELRWSTVCCVR